LTIQEKANIIRLALTGVVIAEYAMIRLKDNTKTELKMKVNNAIARCRDVQKWFVFHTESSPEVSALFQKQFNSNEILMLSELLETCFPLDDNGIEEVIKSIRAALEQPVNS